MTKAVLIAGTNSGVGKTTASMGLMAALVKRNMQVQPYKVGPDYIDPSYHTAICKRTSRNMDTFMMGIEGVKREFDRTCGDADIAVIEGVMGLFDGMNSSEVASSAHVAKSLDVPVILVVNVHGMSRSAAAIVKGFSEFDPEVEVAGVILNKVGSPKHTKMIKDCIPDIPIVGSLPRNKDISVPSRHLGLHMAFECEFDTTELAGFIEENVDIDAILGLAREPKTDDQQEKEIPEADLKIGVAMDKAFCFYYADMFDEFRRNGAEVIFFSPMAGELPDVDGMYYGGGYPELYPCELETSATTKALKNLSADGMPIYGECGGLQYLSTSYEIDDVTYKMADLFPARTVLTKKLQALGYTEGYAHGPFIKGPVRGHEFHYSATYCDNDARLTFEMKRGKGIKDGWDGIVEHNSLACYQHAHPVSFPVKDFVDMCREYKRR
jgi:cobyrinic acid a,c-diamide synthase